MPATSKNQRTLFCIALSIKRGETPRTYSAKAAEMADKMSEKQLMMDFQSSMLAPILNTTSYHPKDTYRSVISRSIRISIEKQGSC